MAGLAPKVQADAWQLISVDINHQCSSDISVIAENLLEPFRMRAHVPVIFSIQETKFWDVPNLELPGHVCYGSKLGARHVVSFGSVLQNYEVLEIRREMYSSAL